MKEKKREKKKKRKKNSDGPLWQRRNSGIDMTNEPRANERPFLVRLLVLHY
jgi:hypothetical protein